MNISNQKLMSEAAATGFRPEMLEKVIRLLDLLHHVRNHPYLSERLVLKGGTALNIFEFDLPRLSVDVDLNYVGSSDVKVMSRERPMVEKAITDVCNRTDLRIERTPADHAGGKWRLRYDSALGGGANLELDLNFLLRSPLWPIRRCDSREVGSYHVEQIPVLDINELACAKMVALLARHAARDLFDAHQLLTGTALDDRRLRLGFVLYGAANRKDWRSVSPDDIGFEAEEIAQNLIPVLRTQLVNEIGDRRQWAERMLKECRTHLTRLLPLTAPEREFLDGLLERGTIKGHLLSDNPDVIAMIEALPMLRWKALNVREHKGLKAANPG